MGQPAGRHGPARDLWVPGVRREVKHLSTCRKGYSVSSGERKRIRPNHGRVIPVGGCVRGVAGACVPVKGQSDLVYLSYISCGAV